jgi:hypothetical protein
MEVSELGYYPTHPLPFPPSQCWEQAASLAMNYQRHRLHDVIGIVSQRLQEIQRFAAAGELHESVDDVQGGSRGQRRGMSGRGRRLGGRCEQEAGENDGWRGGKVLGKI